MDAGSRLQVQSYNNRNARELDRGGVSLLIMEAKFVEASETARELLRVKKNDVGVAPALPIQIYVDK
ncbi:hypothetical protein Plhal304r1_c025g0085041 [Plasmopara halstedii]